MEPAAGWRIDPYVRHELRYFFEGEPTSWVCTGGKIALETVAPAQEFAAATAGGPGATRARSAPSSASAIGGGTDGWRMDPFGTHEFRYYEQGTPTSWVSTDGDIAEEFVVTTDEFLRAVRQDAPLDDTTNESGNGSSLIEAIGANGSDGATLSDIPQFHSLEETEPYLDLGAPPTVAPATAPTPQVVVPAEFLASMEATASAAPRAFGPSYLQPWSVKEEDPWALGAPGLERTYAASEPTLADFQWPRTDRPNRTGRRKARRTTFVIACAVGALAVITSLAAYAASGGTDRAPSSKGGRATTAPVVPTTNATLPIVNDATASWWAATGQPDTHALLTDIQRMNGQLGDPAALGTSCHTFAADAATASSAPPPPTPSINREWQQTLSTVARVANACAAGNYPRLAEDLQPASLTIDDLGAQVANDLR